MFGNTLVLTIGGVATTLVKINQDNYGSEYLFKDAVTQVTARIRHTQTSSKNSPKRDRHNVEVVRIIFADGDEPEETQKAYFVMEQIPSDLSIALMSALATWALASSGANLTSLVGWES
jgi:hypothetical protein